jgi:DNA-binding transcriptional MerR regulator
MNIEKPFTTREICKRLGIRERLLIYWAHERLIEPFEDASGYAGRRGYSIQNLLEIAVINSLWGKISKESIAIIIKRLSLQKQGECDYWIFFGDTSMMPVKNEDLAAETDLYKLFINNLNRSEAVTIVNLKLIKEKVYKVFDIG